MTALVKHDNTCLSCLGSRDQGQKVNNLEAIWKCFTSKTHILSMKSVPCVCNKYFASLENSEYGQTRKSTIFVIGVYDNKSVYLIQLRRKSGKQ